VSVLVLDAALLATALAEAGDEDVIVIDPSSERLDLLEREVRDPRVLYLIGEPNVLPLPDASVDRVLGAGVEHELRRVLRG
jgi:ubiquinone/menaquinone biosynthesis C-methylase UbiE